MQSIILTKEFYNIKYFSQTKQNRRVINFELEKDIRL